MPLYSTFQVKKLGSLKNELCHSLNLLDPSLNITNDSPMERMERNGLDDLVTQIIGDDSSFFDQGNNYAIHRFGGITNQVMSSGSTDFNQR